MSRPGREPGDVSDGVTSVHVVVGPDGQPCSVPAWVLAYDEPYWLNHVRNTQPPEPLVPRRSLDVWRRERAWLCWRAAVSRWRHQNGWDYSDWRSVMP